MDYREKLYDILSSNIGSQDPYLITQFGTYTYSDIAQLARKIANVLNPNYVCCIQIREAKNLVGAIWACIMLEKPFILIPSTLQESFRSEILVNFDRFELLSDDHFTSGEIKISQILNSSNKSIKYEKHVGFLSSGTTGKQKLIWVSYEQISRSLRCLRDQKLVPYTHKQNVFLSQPICHSYGFSCMLEYSFGGSTLVLPSGNDIFGTLNLLANSTVQPLISVLEGVPYFYESLFTVASKLDFPNLKHVGFGGDFVSDRLLDIVKLKLGQVNVSIRYGVTELPSIISLIHFNLVDSIISKFGEVLSIYDIRIEGSMDEQEGEVIICECSSGELFTPLEIYTGDIGILINRRLRILGRNGTFIKHRGFKISLQEIEDVAMSSKMIREARSFVKEGKLFIEIVPANKSILVNDVYHYLSARLPPYSMPDKISLEETVRRTVSGKMVRHVTFTDNN